GYEGASSLIDFDLLGGVISPTYMKSVPTKDGWSNRFTAYCDQPLSGGTPASKYSLVSAGRDGVLAASYTPGTITDFDCDIIYSNGSFTTYPEGIQK
ncbi:MAG: hypothetical protein ABI837_11410, partial [Acidobacteriota bacterium]